jgi:hypothetical protein
MWQAVARAVLVVSVSGRDDVEAVAQALCVQEGLDEDDVEIIADGLYRHLDDTDGGGGRGGTAGPETVRTGSESGRSAVGAGGGDSSGPDTDERSSAGSHPVPSVSQRRSRWARAATAARLTAAVSATQPGRCWQTPLVLNGR